MLKKIDEENNMSKPKQKLTIHRSNFYRPRHFEIASIADDGNCKLAIVKHVTHKNSNRERGPTSFIELYTFRPCFAPKIIETIIEHETVKDIFFLSSRTLLTVSLEATINLYSVQKGTKTASLLTDYGPIVCARYDAKLGILITGTEYGYIASYRVSHEKSTIEPLSKMQKIKAPIMSVEFFPTPLNELEASTHVESIKPRLRSSKRKRKASSSDEESDEDSNKTAVERPEFNYTLYGASNEGLTIYNYQKKTILDTIKLGKGSCKVTFVKVLNNGDFVVGDSTGRITIFDRITQTSRQTAQVLTGTVTCIAISNTKSNLLVVSGKDPTLVVLKQDETTEGKFVIFEKIELHHSEVTSIRFVTGKDFFTASRDGILARFKIRSAQKAGLSLSRVKLLHQYSRYIKFHESEMLIQDDQSLIIWRLPSIDAQDRPKGESFESAPIKHLLLKARRYIHAATFSRRWIAYSTQRSVNLFDKSGDKVKLCKISTKLPNCHILQICENDTKLLACSGQYLYLVDLTNTLSTETSNDISVYPVVSSCNLKSRINVLIDVGLTNSLVVSCGPGSNVLWLYDIAEGTDKPLKQCARHKLCNHEITHISHSGQRDKVFNVFTSNEQLLRLDLSQDDTTLIVSKLDEQPRVVGLPESEGIIGLITLSENYCLLYSSERIFKVDMNSNGVVNVVSDYKYILSINNKLFEDSDQLALVELKSEDYMKMIPALEGSSSKSKFSQ